MTQEEVKTILGKPTAVETYQGLDDYTYVYYAFDGSLICIYFGGDHRVVHKEFGMEKITLLEWLRYRMRHRMR